MIETQDIQALAEKIATVFRPEQIILFGSYAWGMPTADSDVDLLVVLPFEGKSWRMAATIRHQLRSPFPVDLIARTPEQLQQRLQQGDTFLQEITHNGRVLYEA